MQAYYEDKRNNFAIAMSLYVFLYANGRRQDNQRVWATDNFIRKGTGLSRQKLLQAQRDLDAMGLVEFGMRRSNNGKFEKSYRKVIHMWKPEALNKLFSQENNETLEYKLAKKLLQHIYSDGSPIEPMKDFMCELEIRGKMDEHFVEYFYFEDDLLKCLIEFSKGDPLEYTVPTSKVKEIVLALAEEQQYSFETLRSLLKRS